MARSVGAHPKRQSKKAYDPKFLYDFPPSSLFHKNFDLEEKGDTLQHVQSAKQSKTSKSKPATVPATSPLLLMIKAISYSWSSVQAFHKFVAKQVEQQRLDVIIIT